MQDQSGLFPLHNAVSFGHEEMAHLLITHGSNINATDNFSYTPLHEAALKGKTNVCMLLLAYGADPELKNKEGKTPLQLASQDDLKFLLEEYMKARRPNKKENSVRTLTKKEISLFNDPELILREFLEEFKCSEYFELFKDRQLTVEHIACEISESYLLQMGIKQKVAQKIIKSAKFFTTDGQVSRYLTKIPADCLRKTGYTKLYEMSIDDPDYSEIYNFMIHSIVNHSDDSGGKYSTFQIKKIERVLNKGLHQKFLNRKSEIKTEILLDAEESGTLEEISKMDDNDIVNEQMLWHGSPAVGSIVKRGFDERHSCTSGMFGAGIYWPFLIECSFYEHRESFF